MPQSNNPVLTKMTQTKDGYATFGEAPATATATAPAPSTGWSGGSYSVPAGTAPAGVARITIADVIVKTAAMFGVLLVFAAAGWVIPVPMGVYLIIMFVALGVGLWASARTQVSPALYLLYAALEGVVVGAISKIYNQWAINNGSQQGIVAWAVLGTLVTFGVMLVLYRTRIIKANAMFVRMLMIGLVSYFALSVVSILSSVVGIGNGFGFYGLGAMGILFCVVGIGLAAFTLVLDFSLVDKLITMGAPERESWRAAFGLTVTLIWLYLNLLRLLAILSSR